jgi:hypothetical protein
VSQAALPLPKVPLDAQVENWVIDLLLTRGGRPSARELLRALEHDLGVRARWHLMDAVKVLADRTGSVPLTRADREYLSVLLRDGSLVEALRGEGTEDPFVASTIDALLRRSGALRETAKFREMVAFMAKFRRYSPYNNMLVRTQNPACSFYATQTDWEHRFKRALKEDARPMLILAPMHPVMLVYELDQTIGDKLPDLLAEFARTDGLVPPGSLGRLIENAATYGIEVAFRSQSSTLAGFATCYRGGADWKMRVVVHDALDEPSRFGVLCHELAHILLGHLGGDADGWWPPRLNLDHDTVEIEAEAVAHIVTQRSGLMGRSEGYLALHKHAGTLPATVSLDAIAKVAGLVERMSREKLRAPRRRGARNARGNR